MKSFHFAIALIIVILGISQVSAYQLCKRHIVVQHGNTCNDITHAKVEGKTISMKELYRLNVGLDCDNLASGQNICVEMYDSDLHKFTSDYRETCETVANKLNITPEIVKYMNYNLDCSKTYKAGTVFYYRMGGYNVVFRDSKGYRIKKKN